MPTSPSSRRRRTVRRRRAARRRGLLVLGVTAIAGLLLVMMAGRMSSARAALLDAQTGLQEARAAALRGHHGAAAGALARAERRIDEARARASGLPLDLLATIPVVGSPVRAVRTATEAGGEAVGAGRALVHVARDLPTSGRAGIDGHDLSHFHAAALRSAVEIERARNHLERSRRLLAGPASAALPQISGPARGLARDATAALRDLTTARGAMALLGELSDPGTDTRLLVLSQDSMELRPTGGFVGSFGVLHFDHGTASLERFDDVESLAPPSPAMEPPADLAPALRRGWDLSNVNWWPDFPTSAGTAREMYRRQSGQVVDGVIGLTDRTLARLVGALGPLQVPGYAQPVDERTFADRVLYEVELKRPADRPRKQFLVRLSRMVFDELLALPANKVSRATDALDRSFAAGDVQVWFADPARQQRVARIGVDGALPHRARDFLMLVDSNLSAGKANRDVVKDATYRVERGRRGRLVGTLTVTVRNRGAPTPINPYYNGFLRIYVPAGAAVVPEAYPARDDGPAPDGPFRVLSRPVYVRPGEKETVTFRYVLPSTVAPGGDYTLTWLRQAGTPNDTLTAVVGGKEITADPALRELRVQVGFHSPGWFRRFVDGSWVLRRLGI